MKPAGPLKMKEQRAFAAGAQAYLVKPVDNEQLIEQVSRLISAELADD
jgi:CheY-like chemotaxis protein